MRIFFTIIICLFLTVNLFGQNLTNPSLITTEGESLVLAAPDEIMMSFKVETTELTLEKAKAKNNAIFRAAYNFLVNKGVHPKNINPQFAIITPYKVKANKVGQKIGYFSVSKEVELSILKVNDYEDIVDGLFSSGVYYVSEPNFICRSINKHKRKAFKKAIQMAKQKANFLAKELGQSVGNAFKIREIDIQTEEQDSEYFDAEILAMEEDWFFVPGQLEVKVKVEVQFHLN